MINQTKNNNLPFINKNKHTDNPCIDIVTLNGSVNGGRKLQDNSVKILTKVESIKQINQCTWKTPPREIATYLEVIFDKSDEHPDHWLYIAQHFTPKTISSILAQMAKAHQRGDVTIKTPGAYFTYSIKRRKKRKIFRKS